MEKIRENYIARIAEERAELVQPLAETLKAAVAEHLDLYGNATEHQYLGSTRNLMDVEPDELTTEDHENFEAAVVVAGLTQHEVALEEYANGKYHVVIRDI